MDMELSNLQGPDNNNEERVGMLEEYPHKGSCSNHDTENVTDVSIPLAELVTDSNGAPDIVGTPSGQNHNKPVGTIARLRRELKEPVFGNLRVWMLILISFILIIFVIILSIWLCSVHEDDVDDKYNVTEFVVPRYFSGSFTLSNKNVTLDEHSQSTLYQKLTDIYKSSYALGRYFSIATVNPLRSGNSSVEYELKFQMPEEHEKLLNFTLSKEMVYNVLLQQLYDQDTGDPLYIEPTSLIMEVKS